MHFISYCFPQARLLVKPYSYNNFKYIYVCVLILVLHVIGINFTKNSGVAFIRKISRKNSGVARHWDKICIYIRTLTKFRFIRIYFANQILTIKMTISNYFDDFFKKINMNKLQFY